MTRPCCKARKMLGLAAHRESIPEDHGVSLQVKEGLVPLLQDIRERGTPPDTSVLQGTFDAQTQADLCNRIAKELGFDLSKGRLDVSVHPFTGGRLHVPDVKRSHLASFAGAAALNDRIVRPSGSPQEISLEPGDRKGLQA